jgi:hypothetical protein
MILSYDLKETNNQENKDEKKIILNKINTSNIFVSDVKFSKIYEKESSQESDNVEIIIKESSSENSIKEEKFLNRDIVKALNISDKQAKTTSDSNTISDEYEIFNKKCGKI